MSTRSTLMTGGALLASILGLAACGGATSSAAGGAAVLTGGGAGVPGGAAGVPGGAAGVPGGAAGVRSRTGVDPCALITRAEAEAAMAEPATGPGAAQGPDECKFSGTATDSDVVSVTVGTPDVLKRVVTGNGVGGTVTTEPVSGIGDEAIYQPGERVIYVRKGDKAFLIQLVTLASLQSNDQGAGAKSADVTLAQAAVGRL